MTIMQKNKRRKVEHVSSSDEEDDVSFASSEDWDTPEGRFTAKIVNDKAEQDNESASEEQDQSSEDEQGASILKPSQSTAERNASSEGLNRRNRTSNGSRVNGQSSATAYVNGTFKNNLFRLQVDELLGQVRSRPGRREAAAESALRSIKKTIEQLPASEPCAISEAERKFVSNKISIPFPNPRPSKDAKYKLSYSRPANINVVGSFALKTSGKSGDRLEIDMVVTMPKPIFEEKDFLNYRYFYKRAYYLAHLASGIKAKHAAEFALSYKLFHDNQLQPILTVGPAEKDAATASSAPQLNWQVNIIPCIDQDQFSASKLHQNKNCVRQTFSDNHEQQISTPFYNSSIRSEMLMTAYLKLLHNASKRCAAYIDACLLGSTWLRQRGFGSSISAGGFGNFEWNALVALSFHGGGPSGRPLLSEGYSSYQLLKATLQLLATKDFKKHALIIGESDIVPIPTAKGVPLVWDSVRTHNIVFKMSPWSYNLLRSEARNTLNALGDQYDDGFDSAFILNVKQPLYRFDSIVRLTLKSKKSSQENCISPSPESLLQLHSVMQRALSDRVNQIVLLIPRTESWSLGSTTHKSGSKLDITVGLVVNPENARRAVDHGPSAENKDAAASFREFWGEKAELRRFKDGSILESVVWEDSEQGPSITEHIIRYALERHFGQSIDQSKLQFNNGFRQSVEINAETSAFSSLMKHFNQFENDLRDLREMPLSIRQIMPADVQLRFSSVLTPPHGRTNRKPLPASVTLQFEGSGRWPDDLVAIQRTKIAFLLKLEQLLRESATSPSTRIGLENEEKATFNQAFLEVTYNLEATFRLRIYHDREQTLFERQLKNPATDPKSKEHAAVGLAQYKRDYVKTPAHTQALARLCSRYPALSGSIRLTKKWFFSHLLANHIAEEVIELLVARTFTRPWPWQAPSSPHVGFLRTLFWISRWDWRAEPLIVDLSGSGELKESEMKMIHTRFEAWRKLDPALNRVTLFAASNVDLEGTTWTDGQPAKVAASRMTALAKSACAEVDSHQLELDFTSLFTSGLNDFDFVLHIDSKLFGAELRSKRAVATFKNLEIDKTDPQSIGFNPVQDFIRELETIYGSAVVFFYGASERPVIGGLWSPLTLERNWKVNLAYSTIPSKTSDGDQVQASLNKNAVLSEIARMGGNLISKVEFHR